MKTIGIGNEISNELSQKLSILSFICAILVLLIHTPPMPEWLHRVTAVKIIAVPMFFTISGFLFASRMNKDGWYKAQLKRRFKSLVLPYIIWNLLWVSFLYCLTFVAFLFGREYGGLENLNSHLLSPWDIFGLCPLTYPALAPLWFIRCLIVVVLVSPIYKLVGFKSLALGFLSLCAVKEVLPVFCGKWLVIGWIKAFVFFGFGVLGRREIEKVAKLTHIDLFLKISVLAIGWGLLSMQKPFSELLGVPLSIVGLFALINGWRGGGRNYTFPIYLLHPFVSYLIGISLSIIGLECPTGLISSFVWFSIMLVGSIVVAYMLRKYFPRVACFLFGGR